MLSSAMFTPASTQGAAVSIGAQFRIRPRAFNHCTTDVVASGVIANSTEPGEPARELLQRGRRLRLCVLAHHRRHL